MSNNFPRQTSTTLWANFALGVVLLLFAVGVLNNAAAGQLVVWDELYTAERAREFAFQWPLTVRFNFEPTFRKPPLPHTPSFIQSGSETDA